MRFRSVCLAFLAAAASVAPARALTVIHSNDVLGEIEPCGCRSNPLGGMARKANFVKKLADPAVIQLDAGDLLFPTEIIPDALQKQSYLQAQYLLKSMDQIHHDAVVPGEKDFALGVASLEKLVKESKVKFIAANLKRKNGKKAFEPHLILQRTDGGKPVRVAVIGLVGEEFKWPKELKVSPVIATAKAEVKALRKKADYVIALTHQGYEKDEALAKAVPGIDLIIGAHSQTFLQTPVKVGTTQIYQSSFRNQYVGAIPLSKPMNNEAYKLVGLDPAYESPTQAPSAADDLVKEFKQSVAELNSREESRMQASVEPSSGSTEGEAASEVKYHTFVRCSECHIKQFDFWRKTPHARALEPLIQAKQAQNKECLSCHTVGMGDPQGYSFVTRLAESRDGNKPMPVDEIHTYLKAMREADTVDSMIKVNPQASPIPLRQSLNEISRSFVPVQCENCHQPGRDHPLSNGYVKTVDTTQTCLKCHTPERAPEWYKGATPDMKKIEAKRAQVTCPAGELSAE